MNLPELLDILPVRLASGVALIIVVAVLISGFRPSLTDKGPFTCGLPVLE